MSPDEKSTLRVPMTPPLEEIAIDRRYLLEYLLKECEGVEVHFNSPVENLITDGDKVAGVRVNGKDVRADMVIDASGYNSKFRREVPKSSVFRSRNPTTNFVHFGDIIAPISTKICRIRRAHFT